MVHPDQSENISKIIESYSKFISDKQGKIHRLEDWGRRQLAYSINKIHKAHYILMNIEIFPKEIKVLEKKFRLDDFIIRNLIICVNTIISEPSLIFKNKDSTQDVASM